MATKPIIFPILKRRNSYSNQSNYQGYRQEIREDCLFRCVYCDGHEMELGGERSMTLDHFRPKSYKEYSYLENDPKNLMFACHPCNNLKGNDWPAYGMEGTIKGRFGYIDPFEQDRKIYYAIENDGKLTPKQDPAEYLIGVLELNRPFLRLLRRKRDTIYQTISNLENHFKTEIGAIDRLLETKNLNDLKKARFNEEKNMIKVLLAQIRELDKIL